jgi:cytochrome b561
MSTQQPVRPGLPPAGKKAQGRRATKTPLASSTRSVIAACYHETWRTNVYALMLLIPVFGVVAYVWRGRVFDYGLFQLNFRVQMNREVFGPAETIHQFLGLPHFPCCLV